MDLLSVIRRWHFRQGIPIREIRRRTGLSRNTIRKYLRDDAVEPTFKVPKRPSKLDQFAEKLTTWLRVESGKSRKQKRTAKQLHADLVKLGYEGSYSRVAAFARSWKTERQYEKQTSGRGTFVPLIFQPGEAFQFDWSEDRYYWLVGSNIYKSEQFLVIDKNDYALVGFGHRTFVDKLPGWVKFVPMNPFLKKPPCFERETYLSCYVALPTHQLKDTAKDSAKERTV